MEADLHDTGLHFAALHPARPLPIVTPWGEFALFRVSGEIFAVQAFCPHLEGPLFGGTISGESITCPWHFWRFSLRTGARLDFPGRPLWRCEVRIGPRGTVLLAPPTRGVR